MSTLRIKDAPLLPNVDGSEKIPTGGRGDYSVSVDQIKTFAQGGLPQKIEDHINDTENPHQVTKEQVGLGNVNNTSDVDKPISTATQEALDLKANTLDVDNALNLKANIENVNSALNLKSDKTYVDSQDSLKADKTYVDEALSSLSTQASKFYPTLASANADIANISVNQPIQVGESGTNGGLWYKATAGATTLTKSAYDPVLVAKGYSDSINPIEIPQETVLSGVNVSLSTNIISASSGSFITYKYRIKANETYQISAVNNDRFRVVVCNSVHESHTSEIIYDKEIVKNDSLHSVEFTNDSLGVELYVYVASNPVSGLKVSVEPTIRKFKYPVAAKTIIDPIGAELIQENAVGVDKTDFIKQTTSEKQTVLSRNMSVNVNPDTNEAYIVKTTQGWTYLVSLEPHEIINVKLSDGLNNRFRVVVMDRIITEANNDVASRVINLDNTKRDISFTNDGFGKQLIITVNTVDSSDITVYPVVKHVENKLEGAPYLEDINDGSITAEKTDFVEQISSTKNITLSKTITINHSAGDNRTYLANVGTSNAWTYIAPLDPYESVSVSLSDGANDRFRVVVMNREVIAASGQNADRVINLDNNLRSASFENDGAGKFLFITVNTAINTQISVVPTVKSIRTKILGLNVPTPEFEYKPNFKLVVGKIEDSTVNTLNSEAQYPRLSNIKYEYKPDTHPIPVGYLYTSNQAPYKFLYSSGKPDNMEELCVWDMSKTWGGNKNPSQYSQFITDDGDIICVTRGDQLAGSSINPDARQNPIIYPSGDYNNPIVVDFGERIKPTAWARCNGITSVPGEDFFIFSEYTRPTHEKAYIWKVTKPFTNPDNWERVFELTIDRPGSNHAEGQFKHFHATDYDPFSGAIIATTGDYGENGPHFYMSLDKGDTWIHQGGGDEKHYRLSQFVFDKEYIYWGSDTAIPNGHLFIRAPRDSNGFPMLHKDNHEIVYTFPNDSGSAATYNTVYLRNPHGLLFADRQDSTTTTIPLTIWFYCFDTETMHEVAVIEKLEGLNEARGFRCDCIATYQPLNDDRIVCGFNAVSARNAMKIAGNTATNRVNNLTLTVVRSDN